MNKIQIHNFFTYGGIMLLNGRLENTSPDYIKEKTLIFFNKLGKKEFIEFKYKDFWIKYCNRWKISENDYEMMNIINFLTSFLDVWLHFSNKNLGIVFENFEKYIGSIDDIEKFDLTNRAHPVLINHINAIVDFNSRYLKLIVLK